MSALNPTEEQPDTQYSCTAEESRIQGERIRQLTRIGIALSSQKNIKGLLEMILSEARDITGADAGTLYIVNEERTHLNFMILQNDTMKSYLGGASGAPVTLPPVPLYLNGAPNHANVSSHAALTGRTVNIPDVYAAEGFDFTGPRKYDAATGYRSRSMLVLPMRNHLGEIIGVLQLLNAKDKEHGFFRDFAPENVDLVASLASQAAVALTQAQLIQDLRNLFNAFIRSIATAVDEKSPYTGGHITRVVELTMLMAEAINADESGPYARVRFSDDEMEELRLAAWLHDVGKITTPEYIVDKRNKLEAIFDRGELIKKRFGVMRAEAEIRLLRKALDGTLTRDQAEADIRDVQAELDDDLNFLLTCNQPGEFMDDVKLERLRTLAARTWTHDGREEPFLTADELKNLAIRKGSLNAEERRIIENHVAMSIKILNELPFPRRLSRVPFLAGAHHERLDGSGYPRGLQDGEIPLQARIMAVADIFEALTAKDRPYKKPMSLSQAVKILGYMVKDGHIDKDLYEFFIGSGLHLAYAARTLGPEQIDVSLT